VVATATLRRSPDRREPHAMTLSAHLSELRRRLIIALGAFTLAALVVYIRYPAVLSFLEHPYCSTLGAHQACSLYVTGPLDGFAIRLNVTAYGGLVLGSPVLFFELWRFVTPGLKANERRYAIPFVLATSALFVSGAGVAWLTFPHALGFLHAVGGPGIRDIFAPGQYIGLIMALMAIFGLSFEFPVVLVALELAHVVTPAALARARRIAIVCIVVVSGVVTPSSDPFSMLAMALPMLAFYEISILVGKLLARSESHRSAAV
jgi:sec-independent protein translocase protein TatC